MTVDPEDVMSIGNRLLNRRPEAFSEDFAHNRETLQSLTNLGSSHLRNRVAGYITRQKRS